ncbi:TspO/MBR family protein [Actinomyces ruminicola]|uniref:TspO and MBR related proteins n=1 Tax=Actinomyces ruminicola TaxID=332524 RepID=A0A1G9ZAN0_9ACTO|nr:TspO/MBR family protein [Actinomyces ruminicola]SDN17871.1 TspO and MBR related proteins [Actinomyces ruminicola]
MAHLKMKALLTTSALVAATAAVGTAASDPNGDYYARLTKPDWNPPNEAFPIAWTTLYTDIALTTGLTLADLWEAAEITGSNKEAKRFLTATAANLALNGGWSWAFFRAKQPALSAVWSGVLAASSADLTRRVFKISKVRGMALAPYAAWTAFATALSCAVWKLNDRAASHRAS